MELLALFVVATITWLPVGAIAARLTDWVLRFIDFIAGEDKGTLPDAQRAHLVWMGWFSVFLCTSFLMIVMVIFTATFCGRGVALCYRVAGISSRDKK